MLKNFQSRKSLLASPLKAQIKRRSTVQMANLFILVIAGIAYAVYGESGLAIVAWLYFAGLLLLFVAYLKR